MTHKTAVLKIQQLMSLSKQKKEYSNCPRGLMKTLKHQKNSKENLKSEDKIISWTNGVIRPGTSPQLESAQMQWPTAYPKQGETKL